MISQSAEPTFSFFLPFNSHVPFGATDKPQTIDPYLVSMEGMSLTRDEAIPDISPLTPVIKSASPASSYSLSLFSCENFPVVESTDPRIPKHGAVANGPKEAINERPTSDRISAYGAPWLTKIWGIERVFRVDALPPGPRPISYKVICAEGASWANRRAEAHPETPPPTIATRNGTDAIVFAAAEVIAANGIAGNKKRFTNIPNNKKFMFPMSLLRL
mmetsp:Transcript_2758/g.5990  ORF Transcript_2758/g.5990 Transcript_2758/m.5990 type:complete len:217 (+) Transcript_2758:983-1633(+)